MSHASVIPDEGIRFQLERSELETVLQSASFQRAPNLSRILTYICNRYFEGTAHTLKEYSIAVEALGRASSFDPQTDAIVRVDLHLLRKRLEAYYRSEGTTHPIRILLPAGQYGPQFVETESALALMRVRNEGEDPGFPLSDSVPRTATESVAAEQVTNSASAGHRKYIRRRTAGLVSAAACLTGLLGGATLMDFGRFGPSRPLGIERWVQPSNLVPAILLRDLPFGGTSDPQEQAIRIGCGAAKNFVDSAGLRWDPDRYFTGGESFHRTAAIGGTLDPDLFETGRQGIFHYDIPAPPRSYEVHLLFAETDPTILDGMRQISFTIAEGTSDTVDVVADAGGQNTATMKVYSNIHPGPDGKIHLNFWSRDAFLNGIEIVPESGDRPNPIRISALMHPYTDRWGHRWLTDRFYRGGRNIDHEFSQNRTDQPLFLRERYGNFSYIVPVAASYNYELTLYMAERYWGINNSGQGGTGSRIFDIYCNGMQLLRDFDLLQEQGSANQIAVRFQHLKPDAMGKLALHFVPVKNYPVLNALEVKPE